MPRRLAIFKMFIHLRSFKKGLLHNPAKDRFGIGADRFIVEVNFVVSWTLVLGDAI
jgi:hypothetical protein